MYQLDENNESEVISYYNKTFKGAERKYFMTEKELLATIRCLEKFRIIIRTTFDEYI